MAELPLVPVSRLEELKGNPLKVDVIETELKEYMDVPFIERIVAVQVGNGLWVRRAECPELPQCVVEGTLIEDLYDALEVARRGVIRALLEAGKTVPCPRPRLNRPDTFSGETY